MASPPQPVGGMSHLVGYLVRTLVACIMIIIVFFFMGVHVYYTSAGLSNVVVLLSLLCLLACFGLSVTSLVISALVGPGELPSRFRAARLEMVLREELHRILAKAQGGCGSRLVTAAAGSEREVSTGNQHGSICVANRSGSGEPPGKSPCCDEIEGQQLANIASTAAIFERSAWKSEEEALERAALEARLRVYKEYGDTAYRQPDDGVAERGHGSQKGASDCESDASDGSVELPLYMTEAMQMRRQRKIRRGLEIVLVSEAARRVLKTIDDTDVGRKQEEMALLIPGANWCRFCNFYQMNDTRHCVVCERCVYHSKLHCVSTGRCIGYANSKYYVLFLFYLLISLVMADALDLYCIVKGYTYFFDRSREDNTVFYLVFVYSASLAAALLSLLVHYLYTAGCDVGLLTGILTRHRSDLETYRAFNNGVQYEPVLPERTAHVAEEGLASPLQELKAFSWRRAMDTVGEGLPVWKWFWLTPTQPAQSETDDPPEFWDVFRRAIRLRLRSVADKDDVFSDEDEVRDADAAGTPTSVPFDSAVVIPVVHITHAAPSATP